MKQQKGLRHLVTDKRTKNNFTVDAKLDSLKYRPICLKFSRCLRVVVPTPKWSRRSTLLLACIFLCCNTWRVCAASTGTTPALPDRYSGTVDDIRLSDVVFNAPTVFTRYEESKRKSPPPAKSTTPGQLKKTTAGKKRTKPNACSYDAVAARLTCTGVDSIANDVDDEQRISTFGSARSTTSGRSSTERGSPRPTPTVMNKENATSGRPCAYNQLRREFLNLSSDVTSALRTLKIEHFSFDGPLTLAQLLTVPSITKNNSEQQIFPNLDQLVFLQNSFGAKNSGFCGDVWPLGGATISPTDASVVGIPSAASKVVESAEKIVQLDKLRDLQLIANNLTWLSAATLGSLPQLHTLVLRDNKLISLEEHSFEANRFLVNISMAGNNWSCQKMEWFLAWTRQHPLVAFIDKNVTVCEHNDGKATGRTTFGNLIDLCPRNCSCHLVRALVEVDCRQRAFHSFPPVVPVNTSILHMENNSIASLESIVHGENYSKLRFFYLDNNLVESLNILERTEFYNGLVALHVSGNKLIRVPVYIISRLTDLRLGRNPWNCECDAVSSFYDFLMSRAKDIRDVDDIRCAMDGSVIHRAASKHKFCYDGSGSLHPLDVLNATLVLIILVIVVNVMYDYTIFQVTGHFPRGPCCFNLARSLCPPKTHKLLTSSSV